MAAVVASALMRPRGRMWPVVLVSTALHGALVVTAVLHKPAPVIDLEQKPIVAKLVRLGEKKPPELLPRKEAAARAEPVAPEKGAVPTPAPVPTSTKVAVPEAKPKPKQTTSAAQPSPGAPRPDPLASVLAKVRREQVLGAASRYGDPSGDPEGDSTEASAGDHYLALATRSIQAEYRLPTTISEQDRMHLRATVVLFIEPDGTVSRHAFEQRSGNAAFDAALERALQAIRLPPPPAELRERYRSLGLGVHFHM